MYDRAQNSDNVSGNQVIVATGLAKRYSIGASRDSSLKGTLSNLIRSRSAKSEDFWALKDVSFSVNRGDVVGIVGRNGAGKSTLLKLLSEITRPTEGRIEITGRVASLLEVGTGFHPELTGRENIFMNGTILGMSRNEVKNKIRDIIDFADVEKFIDTPVKHYSSGMYVRLAFSVAAHLEPEILVIDEVLSVGDAEFQKKCLGKMQDVAESGRTVLFVSHNLGSVKILCNKGILLQNGRLVFDGDISEVIDKYQKSSKKEVSAEMTSDTKESYVRKAVIVGENNEFSHGDPIHFSFEIAHNSGTVRNKRILVRLMNQYNQVVSCFEQLLDEVSGTIQLEFPKNPFTKGAYYLNAVIYRPGVLSYDDLEECCHFEILDNPKTFVHLPNYDIGNVSLDHQWSIK